MSNKLGFALFLVVFLAFSGPIIITMVALEFLGLGEYATPIFVPILLAMFILSMVVGAAISLAQRRTAVTPVLRGEDPLLVRSRNMSAAYTIPLQCPNCGKPIELDQVRWESPMVFVCAECLGPVRVKISE